MKIKYLISSALILGGLITTSQAALVADIAGDYVNAPGYVAGTSAPTAAPTGWSYLSSTLATGGTENALSAGTGLGNSGNTGFGVADATSNFNVGVLGGTTGGAQYEIFSDGFDGNPPNFPTGNEGVVGTDLLLHPGGDAASSFIIVRYTISASDILNGTLADISGSFRDLAGRPGRGAQDQSITADIFHNGNSLFSVTGGDTAQGTAAYLEQSTGAFNITGLTVAANDTISFVVGNNGPLSGDETALTGTINLVPEPSSTALLGLGALGLMVRRRRA